MKNRIFTKSQMLLSVVALLTILLIGVGITYGWIEGGTTYSIQTENATDVKTGDIPIGIGYSEITLNPSSTASNILLFDYDNTTSKYQDLHFTPVSSANGKDFFFPTAFGETGNVLSYRANNTNDIGTKYLSFDFDVVASEKCYLAFNGTPSISATKGGASVGDSGSEFRVMLTDGHSSHIFSNATTAQDSKVVTDVSGTPSTLTTEVFTKYTKKSDSSQRLFSFEKGDTCTMTMSVWLDQDKATSALNGADVSIELQMIVDFRKYTFGIDAITFDDEGNKVTTNGFTGGSINYGTSTYSSAQTSLTCVEDESITLTATPKDGYKFVGWYSSATIGDSSFLTSELSITKELSANGNKYYAVFEELGLQTTTIYIEKRPNFSSYNVYAYYEAEGIDTKHYTGVWGTTGGNAATLDADTGYYKITFDTTDTGPFYTIISNNSFDQYPASGQRGLEGQLGGTYLFTYNTSGGELIEFDPSTMFTFNVSSVTTGCTANINGSGTSVKLRPGQSVTINAVAPSGYEFIGWYTNSACTSTIGSTYKSATQTIKPSAAGGSTLTYYAKFNMVATTDYYIDTSAVSKFENDGAVLAYSVGSGSYQTATKVEYNGIYYWKISVPAGTSSFNIGKYVSGTIYSKLENIAVSGSNNMFILHNGYTSGVWVTYTPGARLIFFDADRWCKWFNDYDAVIAISTNGGTSYTRTTAVTYGGEKYFYYNLPSNITSFKIGRVPPTGTMTIWDSTDGSVSTNSHYDLYVMWDQFHGYTFEYFLH